MRRRLVLVLMVFSLLTVAAFVAPLLEERAASRAQTWTLSRAEDLDRFVALAALDGGREELARSARRHADLYGEGILVVDPQRRVVVSAGLRPTDAGVPAALDAALRNQPAPRPARLGPLDADPVLLWRPVGTGTRAGGVVVMRADPAQAAADVGRSWTVVLLGACAAALAFVALALVLARWVLRPVGALARGVGEVAAGRTGERIPESVGPTELRELASSFNRMSAAVRAGAEEQRRVVADASHQIRNPLAALRLRVDSLEVHVDPAGQATYDRAVGEVDRLERLLDGMLDLASAEATATAVAVGTDGSAHCDAAAVAEGRVDAWRVSADSAGVDLHGAGEARLVVRSPASDLEQVLDVLIDNAIRHAGRGATVQVRWSAGEKGTTVVVSDDGPGIPEADVDRARSRFWQGTASNSAGGSGLGLAIADRLAAARGGRLELGRSAAGGLQAVVVLVPAPPDPPVVPGTPASSGAAP